MKLLAISWRSFRVKLALIELPVGEDLVDDLLHHALDAGRVGSTRDREAASTMSASMTRPASLVWGFGPG